MTIKSCPQSISPVLSRFHNKFCRKRAFSSPKCWQTELSHPYEVLWLDLWRRWSILLNTSLQRSICWFLLKNYANGRFRTNRSVPKFRVTLKVCPGLGDKPSTNAELSRSWVLWWICPEIKAEAGCSRSIWRGVMAAVRSPAVLHFRTNMCLDDYVAS